jgi:hypothetical protein
MINGGVLASTGSGMDGFAYRARLYARKSQGKTINADNYGYALAA